MPGFNRTGPAGAGPRTGRARGLCNQPGDRAKAIEDRNLDYEGMWDFWPFSGGRGRFRGGRGGRGRGFGRGRMAMEDPAGGDAIGSQEETVLSLRRQIEELAAELDRVKARLSEYSSAEGGSRE
ncbi:DUF5320 domain-containing protein [bacterium]|nr:DUF5320 domain-containing protein [bacterium]